MTTEEALAFADKYGLAEEIQNAINSGATPEDALEDWDII